MENERVANDKHRHLVRLFARFLHEELSDFFTELGPLLERAVNDGGGAPDAVFQNLGGLRYLRNGCSTDSHGSRNIGDAPCQPTAFWESVRFINVQQNIAERLRCFKIRANFVPRHRPELVRDANRDGTRDWLQC